MKKNDLFIYLLFSISLLVFAPGRLCYGIILILEFNFLLVFEILLSRLLVLLKLDEVKNICLACGLIFLTTLYKLLIRIYSPVLSFDLGILFYMPALNVFLLGNIYDTYDFALSGMKLSKQFKLLMRKSLYFSIYSFWFFLIRDLFGYGSISLPWIHGAFNLFVIGDFKYSFIGTFFASIPGSLCIVAFSYILFAFLLHCSEIFKNRGVEK